MTGPDFMVVGTQKAGTTWLFECLNEHPGVFVPELKACSIASGRRSSIDRDISAWRH